MCSNFSFHWSVTYLSQGWVFLHTFQRSTNPWIELSGPLPFRHLHSTDMGKNPFHARQKLHRVVCKVGSRHYKRQDERYMSGTAVILNKVEPQLVGTLKARTSTTAQVTSIGGFKGTTTTQCVGVLSLFTYLYYLGYTYTIARVQDEPCRCEMEPKKEHGPSSTCAGMPKHGRGGSEANWEKLLMILILSKEADSNQKLRIQCWIQIMANPKPRGHKPTFFAKKLEI